MESLEIMAIKTASPPTMKDDIGKFFTMAETAACCTHEEATQAMSALLSGKNHSRMVDGIVFNVNETLNNAAEDIVKAISKALGTLAGDEGYVSKTLWKHAAARLAEPEEITSAVNAFLQDINNNANTPRRYIKESHVIRLAASIQRFDLGPVGLVTGSRIADELNRLSSTKLWLVEVGSPGVRLDANGGQHKIGVGAYNWDIEVVAADAHLAEQAGWLAGVAISLLRLVAGSTLGPLRTRIGQAEPQVFMASAPENTSITATKAGISTGGWSHAPEYYISEETRDYCSDAKFEAIVSKVFKSPKNSVAERIKQCLGWLARGRQSEDRAERMLYFFTALEAMLSTDDKSAPVVQTIARNAASILTNEPAGRARNAKLIRDLYTSRSALVHTGTRNVTRRQANTIEDIADSVCWRILDQVDLAQPLPSFQTKLLEASYGLPWGDENTHLLPISNKINSTYTDNFK